MKWADKRAARVARLRGLGIDTLGAGPKRPCLNYAVMREEHLYYRPTGAPRDVCARCQRERSEVGPDSHSPPDRQPPHRPFLELECE